MIRSWCRPVWSAIPTRIWRKPVKCLGHKALRKKRNERETHMQKTSQQRSDEFSNDPQPIRGDRGASILGPRNVPLERENPDLLASPSTDAGTIPNLKFSFAAARNRLTDGGWAREITVRELPVATSLAGVNMRLKPGGIRELHWHKEAEWAYMLAGRARITAVDEQGRTFIDDVGEGDLWNFPSVIPHSIQGLEEGCEFLLVFDNGSFSENETFLITDLFKHTPRDVLAKNFGVPEAAFANIPIDVEHERYIFSGKVPGPMSADVVQSGAGIVPQTFSHHMMAQEPIKAAGGWVRITDSSNFPAATTIAAARAHDRVRLGREGADFRLPGGRRGLRAVRDGALRPEPGRRAAALPGDVPQRPLHGRVAQPVDGPDATGTGAGPLESDPGRDGRLAQAKEACRLRMERKQCIDGSRGSCLRFPTQKRCIEHQQEMVARFQICCVRRTNVDVSVSYYCC